MNQQVVFIYVCLVYEYTNIYWRIRGYCLQKGIVEAEFRDTKDLCLICMFLNKVCWKSGSQSKETMNEIIIAIYSKSQTQHECPWGSSIMAEF